MSSIKICKKYLYMALHKILFQIKNKMYYLEFMSLEQLKKIIIYYNKMQY